METVATKIKVNFGIPFETPHGEIRSFVGANSEEASKIKAELHNKAGLTFSDYNIYLVVPCVSDQAAESLKSILSSLWNSSDSQDPTAKIIKEIFSVEKFQAEFLAHQTIVSISISPLPDKLEEFKALYEISKSMDPTLVNHKLHVVLNLALGRSISDILNSRNLSIGLWQSTRFEFDMLVRASVLEAIKEFTRQSQASPTLSRIITGLGSIEGITANLNFCDVSQIPQVIKDALRGHVNFEAFRVTLSLYLTSLISSFTQYSEGEIVLVTGIKEVIAEIVIRLPGFSEFLNQPSLIH